MRESHWDEDDYDKAVDAARAAALRRTGSYCGREPPHECG